MKTSDRDRTEQVSKPAHRKLKKIVIVALLVSIVSTSAGAFWLMRPDLFTRAGSPAETVLLVGCDSGGLTDSIYVVYSDPRHRSMRLVSIPRDTVVSGRSKINSLMKRHGLPKLKQTIEDMVGHKIGHTMVLHMEALPGFLDKACPRGVPINVPYHMKYTDHSAGLSYDIPSGAQRLHGSSLVYFLRDRSDHKGDVGRAPRQVQAIRAVGKAVISNQWGHIASLVASARKLFPTDLSDGEILDLVRNYRAAGAVSLTRIAGAPITVGGISYFQPDQAAIRKQSAFAIHGTVVPEQLVVLNATTTPHLATLAAHDIKKHLGVAASDVGNSRLTLSRRTTIHFDQSDLMGAAEEIARVLQVNADCRQEAGTGENDPSRITVELGSDYQPHREVTKP